MELERWQRRDRAVAFALAALAALRVAAFAAGFPFFSNVDEHRHIDAVLKYARGFLPTPGDQMYEPQMPTLLGVYGSPEYHMRDGTDVRPPPWRGSMADTVGMIEYNERFLRGRPNLEASSPPVYYALAGAWLAAARSVGVESGRLLYWVRGLNAVGYFALVLASFALVRAAYPTERFVHLGVPALLVVFPQDALYYITPDALSPLLGAAGLAALTAASIRTNAPAWLFGFAGLACGLAFLTKYTNAVLVALCGVATLVAMLRGGGSRARLGWMWLGLGVPIAIWLGRNQLVFGDWLATGVKLERLGWGTNPLAAYWNHPILSVSGLRIFATELLQTFWRGELVWHRKPMFSPAADAFYVLSSLGYLGLAGWGFASRLRSRADRARPETLCDGLCLAVLALSAAVLALLSMHFVFGNRTNPTAANPYLSQGRLVACALVPFAVVYVRGIAFATARLPMRSRIPAAWGLLACTLAVVVVSELRVSAAVFASPYNWFHFP